MLAAAAVARKSSQGEINHFCAQRNFLDPALAAARQCGFDFLVIQMVNRITAPGKNASDLIKSPASAPTGGSPANRFEHFPFTSFAHFHSRFDESPPQ
jgi:hypothetical protein